MKKLLPIFLSLFLPLCAAPASAAAFSPLQIGLGWPDETAETGLHGFQLISTNTPVIGLRLNLPGSVNDTVGGLEMGIISVSETFSGIRLNALLARSETVNGISLGLIDATETLNGLQLAPIAFADNVRGIQAGLLLISYGSGDTFYGVQLGFCNFAEDLRGAQIGGFNNGHRFFGSNGSVHGVQLGIYNSTPDLHGVQIGIFNFADTLHGLQIGLVNIATESDYPCLPLLRASF